MSAELKDLALLVKQMRDLQKQFFAQNKNTASPYERAKLIEESKKAERQVDEAVQGILHPDTQGKLF